MTALSDTFSAVAGKVASTPTRKRFFAGAGILALAVFGSFSIFATAPAPVVPERLEKAWPVSVIEVDPEQLAPVFNTFGKVESNNVAELRTNVVAEVTRVHVREGQWVATNDLLLELRKDELSLRATEKEADLQQEVARLNSIETEYRLLKETSTHYESVWQLSQKKLKRQKELLDKRMISQALMDDAVQVASQATIEYQRHVRTLADFPSQIAQQKARVDRARALRDQSLIDLDKTEVRAPFSGPILSVSVAVGDHSEMNTPLVVMADESEFVIRAPVPDLYAQRFRDHLQQGDRIRSQMEGIDVGLNLVRLSRDVKSGQSGLDAFFEIDNEAQWALPEIGRVVGLTVTLPPEQDVVALPVQSIYENDRIYRVEDDRLQAIRVARVGDFLDEDGQYRVLVRAAELQSGQAIVTTQLPRAISGLLVSPLNATTDSETMNVASR